jgi:DinB superfamily
MEISWRTVLWPQFGAAIAMLDNALVACPARLWNQRLWSAPSDHALPPESAEFWYLAYHALVWTDLYLTGVVEAFAPLAPFTREQIDPADDRPNQPYTQEELRTYLAYVRTKGHTTLGTLTDEQARHPFTFPWAEGPTVSYVELQVYNLRHLQEHAAQLSLFLGQHGIPDEALDWVARAQDDPQDAPQDDPDSR